MKPKLIIINGPCGVGKNTIAERYKGEHPETFIVDIDEIRRTIPNYRENREKSYEEACRLALNETEARLRDRLNVVIPNKIKRINVLDDFNRIADECDAEFCEFFLWTTKKDAIGRAIKRGFRPGSLLQKDRLVKMYDELEETLKKRKNAFIVDSSDGEIEEVYSEVLQYLES